jgi:hypothetical protein
MGVGRVGGLNACGAYNTRPMVPLGPQLSGSSYFNSMPKFDCPFVQSLVGMPNLAMSFPLVSQVPL